MFFLFNTSFNNYINLIIVINAHLFIWSCKNEKNINFIGKLWLKTDENSFLKTSEELYVWKKRKKNCFLKSVQKVWIFIEKNQNFCLIFFNLNHSNDQTWCINTFKQIYLCFKVQKSLKIKRKNKTGKNSKFKSNK